MPNSPDHPSNPSSALSKKARLAHWITGGTNRRPSTMTSLTRMAKDRNDMGKATEAWRAARKRGLDEHQRQWGRSGVPGALHQARGAPPRPTGTALLRWFRERGSDAGIETGYPEQSQQHGEQGRPGTGPAGHDAEDDIYSADDDTT